MSFSTTSNRKRELFATLIVSAILFLAIASTTRAEDPSFPSPECLQTGDLIWPKKPGAIVPYNSQPGEAGESDSARWSREKQAYLKKVEAKPDPTQEDKARYAELEKMTYIEFVSRYLDNRSPGEVTQYGAGNISVGHVGIIQVVNGKPDVIEAMMKPGVRRIPYADWIRERPGELVWQGRLIGASSQQLASMATTAASYIGRRYDFWNFDLGDTSGFYCSKLAWFCIMSATGVAPDDNANPKRILWYSPKQLMNSKHLKLIFNPGSYSR